ncbi:MAG: hypothetical protein K9M81_03200, partial [Chthoniobacterales bacterium]|nr:hypothetical protein [Chthoniobacterales bacterium]
REDYSICSCDETESTVLLYRRANKKLNSKKQLLLLLPPIFHTNHLRKRGRQIDTVLTRIFHTDSAAACEHLMDTASASNCSSGSMKHTAVVAIHHLPCLHQDSQRLATNQYEICGLTRTFHTDRGLLVTISMKYSNTSSSSVSFSD